MKQTVLILLAVTLLASACSVQKPANVVKEKDVKRILSTLASDEMQGRGTFTPGIERAGSFIESEFKKIGLQSLAGEENFRQELNLNSVKPQSIEVIINGQKVKPENSMAITELPSINWTQAADAEVLSIKAGESFFDQYRSILRENKNRLVLVDASHAANFKRLADFNKRGKMGAELKNSSAVVFVLGAEQPSTFTVQVTNRIEKLSLFNVAGMLPGKSKAKEVVVFSGHYDHLGIVKPIEGDSIANGADDDASGTTAVIALAKHYKKLNNNERTLIFVAFTAEEIGGFGSRYFSEQQNPDEVVAMFNIEMIGKESKFGSNSAFITGYDKSDFGEILQRNLSGTAFKFYPDPYPKQNLFYRSDNATLAAQGVPAHTISTDKIDSDKFYHTVNDELETLNIDNITATIRAIALSARSIVAGTDTPKRIPKLDQ